MLVLSRKNQESVIVGVGGAFEQVLKVTVLGVTSTGVRLGFEADADVLVHRAEVWERIRLNSPQAGPPGGPATLVP